MLSQRTKVISTWVACDVLDDFDATRDELVTAIRELGKERSELNSRIEEHARIYDDLKQTAAPHGDTPLQAIQNLCEELSHLRGAMEAQDERERLAGEACGVPWTEHDCDWPQWVAEEVNRLRDNWQADRSVANEAMHATTIFEHDLTLERAKNERLRTALERMIRMVETTAEAITTEEWHDISNASAALSASPASAPDVDAATGCGDDQSGLGAAVALLGRDRVDQIMSGADSTPGTDWRQLAMDVVASYDRRWSQKWLDLVHEKLAAIRDAVRREREKEGKSNA